MHLLPVSAIDDKNQKKWTEALNQMPHVANHSKVCCEGIQYDAGSNNFLHNNAYRK